MENYDSVLARLKSRFGETNWKYTEFRDGVNRRIEVPTERISESLAVRSRHCPVRSSRTRCAQICRCSSNV